MTDAEIKNILVDMVNKTIDEMIECVNVVKFANHDPKIGCDCDVCNTCDKISSLMIKTKQ